MPIKICFPNSLALSGVIELIHYAWVELLELQQMSVYSIPVELSQKVITAIDENDPSERVLGFITYTRHPLYGFTWINLSYVRPENRREGIYKKLFMSLVELEKSNTVAPVNMITSGIHKNNLAQISASKNIGRTSSFEYHDYKLN